MNIVSREAIDATSNGEPPDSEPESSTQTETIPNVITTSIALESAATKEPPTEKSKAGN
jgi:hypothetical protein